MIELEIDDVTDPDMRAIIEHANIMLRAGRQQEVLPLLVSIVVGAVMASGTAEHALKDYLMHCVTQSYATLPESGDSIH
jgi:PhoPQ-activated pathogenicity-related protein